MDPGVLRRWLLRAIGALGVVAVGLIVLPPPSPPATPAIVVHWANGHLAGDDDLLPTFARRFNAAGYRTSHGSPIEVRVSLVNSSVIRRELLSRAGGFPVNRNLQPPAVVTPVSEQLLNEINGLLQQPMFELSETRPLVKTWIGIATYRDMAQCLGWPTREIGYADIVRLASNPKGWTEAGCYRPDWVSEQPLRSATDPNSSTTGRSILYSLYSIATGKRPEELVQSDIGQPEVANAVEQFVNAAAHYVPDTLLLNCEIFRGPAYGHFFPIAEDNLVKLYKGKVVATDPELQRLFPCQEPVGPITRDMVMIYPREGSTANTHPAALVRAPWVDGDQEEGARRWIQFLSEDRQQAAFMEQGFRPATQLPLGCPICGQYGSCPSRAASRDRLEYPTCSGSY